MNSGNSNEIIKKSNIDYFSKLNKNDQNKIMYISNFLNKNSISSTELSQIQSDLIDMTLQANQDGKDLDCIIGNDLDKFCSEILDNGAFKRASKQTLFFNSFFRSLLIYTSIVLFIFCTPLYALVYSFIVLVFLLFSYIEMYFKVQLSFKTKAQKFVILFFAYAGILVALLCTKPLHQLYDIAIPNTFVLFIFTILFIGFIVTEIQRRAAISPNRSHA